MKNNSFLSRFGEPLCRYCETDKRLNDKDLFVTHFIHHWFSPILLFFMLASSGTLAVGQTQVFFDNFNRTALNTGSPTTYFVTVTGGNGGVDITSDSCLELTNDISADTNSNGVVYVSGLTQSFSSTYNQTLHADTAAVEWTFNFRFNRSSHPSGMSPGSYGTAIILASTNGIFIGANAGNGYAIVYGGSGTPNPIRLVKFSGGLTGTLTTIISSGVSDISAVNNYASVRVRYDPHGDYWYLYVRDDGATKWSDPSTGVTSQKGSATIDTTYTSTVLTNFGFYWAYGTSANQTSRFDNFGVRIIPSMVLSGLELFLTSDSCQADTNHAVLFPHAGMGNGTLYAPDDWSYNSPVLTFFVVPKGTQSLSAAEFIVNWDTTKASLAVKNGTMFDFLATQRIASGKLKIDVGASSNINVLPAAGKYLAALNFTILQPGCDSITMTGVDARYVTDDSQTKIQTAAHSGVIKFYLGDFTSQNNYTTCGDGKINFDDIVQFALAYFSNKDSTTSGYKSKFDIGPTNSDGMYFSMPNPDGQIQFEDLVTFSMGYGKSACHQLCKTYSANIVLSTQEPAFHENGTIVVPLTIAGDVERLHALSVSTQYPSSQWEYSGYEKCGEMNNDDCFMAATSKGDEVVLDAAFIGTPYGLSSKGTIANLIFKNRSDEKNGTVSIQSVKARDAENKELSLNIGQKEISEANAPLSFALAQNYPNPFNPVTIISYQLPVPCMIDIRVYDILGRDVATLEQEIQGAGTHQVTFHASHLASGIYFYRLSAVPIQSQDADWGAASHGRRGSFYSMKKMLLLK